MKNLEEIHFYKNENEAILTFASCLFYCGFLYNNEYYIGYIFENQYKGILLQINNTTYDSYYDINLKMNNHEKTIITIEEDEELRKLIAVCFLPKLTERGLPKPFLGDDNFHCIVKSDWNYNTE